MGASARSLADDSPTEEKHANPTQRLSPQLPVLPMGSAVHRRGRAVANLLALLVALRRERKERRGGGNTRIMYVVVYSRRQQTSSAELEVAS